MTMTRATEIQMIILNKGVERGMIALVTELFERMAAQEQQLREAALIQLQMAKMMEQITDGAGAIRKEVERLRGERTGSEDSDLPPTAT